MKTVRSLGFTLTAMALLALLWTGCGTTKSKPKVDWDSRLGTYTYDQAVTEFGPPDKETKLSDGQTVADWISHSSGSSGLSVGLGIASFGRSGGGGIGVSQGVGSSSRDHVMRLTFGPDGRLVHWAKN